MQNFNLIDSPWIPVRWRQASNSEPQPMVSLNDAFSRSAEIADLDCAPHERIALTRLLVCITHAALGAPEDEVEWDGFADNLAEDVPAYLKQTEIYPHFNLLGDGPRFLQSKKPTAKTSEGYPLCKIFFQLSSGNSPKLFDHWGEDARPWAPPAAALGLLCLQNFFVGGSMASKVRGNGPSLKSLQMLLVGDSLQSTILRNCIDLETLQQTGGRLGTPTWETAPDNNLLARLAPTSCALWLSDDLATTLIDQGYKYLEYEAYRDPYATTFTIKDNRRLLRANLEKGIWRDLHLLTNIKHSDDSAGPLNLQSFNNRRELEEQTNLWVGELVKAKDAKIIDCIESTFTVPQELFCEAGRNIYAAGIEHAELISKKLYGAIKTYWSALKHENPPIAEGQKQFWHSLDQQHRELIQLACDPEGRRGLPAIGTEGAEDVWTKTVRTAARSAFDAVCPRSTPRQIQAYANGIKPLIRALFPKSKDKKPVAKKSTKSDQIEMTL
ncbi:MAG: CRISPR system Cascade subunit CasA [Bacteroidia bacterium]|jgi:CRISPR system Cascade subunit CasA